MIRHCEENSAPIRPPRWLSPQPPVLTTLPGLGILVALGGIDNYMSSIAIDYQQLHDFDRKALLEFEGHLWTGMDRETAARRENKLGGKKKQGRRRPFSSSR
jgi:hypothetical protein